MKPINDRTLKSVQLSLKHGKTILLVDVNANTRDNRAKTFRRLGVNVQAVGTATAALSRCDSVQYSLVLVDFGKDVVRAQALVGEIRSRNPRQCVAFLIGRPAYVAYSLEGAAKPSVTSSVNSLTAPNEQLDFGSRVKQAESELQTSNPSTVRGE